LGLIYIALTVGFQLLSPWVLKHAIDSLAKAVTTERLLYYGGLILALAVTQGVFRFLMRNTLIVVSRKMEYDLRNDYFAELQRRSPTFFQTFKTGDLMARVTNDLNAVRNILGPGIMYFFNTLILAVTAIILMALIDVRLTLYALIPFPIMSALVYKAMGHIHKHFDAVQAQFATLTAKVQENLSGIRVVKAYVQERSETRTFETLNQDYLNKNLILARIRGALWAGMSFLSGLSLVILLWLGGQEVISGRITLGDFVAFAVYLAMLIWPMIALGWVINIFQQGVASMGRINEIMDYKTAIQDDDRTDHRIHSLQGEIEFRNVSFSYDGRPVLRDINLKIESGMTVAIVGPTGSGKTTLLNLLPRLYEVEQGQVLIDGIDVRRIPLAVLRANIGYVPQETFLFSDTIKENIAFGIEKPSMPEIEEAAVIAQLKPDIQGFPDQYETMVGERGITLSGGQKQRTAIARAVIRKPKILILDDALSSVDTYTEEEILKRLRVVMENRTSIIVSHRISTVRDADLIVVLDDGHIVEQGTHEALLELDGVYAELYRKQLLEEALEEL